jgi:hypothetical protein
MIVNKCPNITHKVAYANQMHNIKAPILMTFVLQKDVLQKGWTMLYNTPAHFYKS